MVPSFIDVEFTALESSKFVKVSGGDLFSKKRILVCSMPRYLESLDHLYIKYLKELQLKYQCHGIDDIVLLNSNHLFALVSFDSQWKDMSGYYDHDQKFLGILKDFRQQQQSLDFLAQRWKYQALITNGELEFFIDHPLDDYADRLGEKFKSDAGFKSLLSSNEPEVKVELRNIFRNPKLFINKNNYGYVHEKLLSQKLFYFDLWPANDLVEHLDSATST